MCPGTAHPLCHSGWPLQEMAFEAVSGQADSWVGGLVPRGQVTRTTISEEEDVSSYSSLFLSNGTITLLGAECETASLP